MRILVAASAIAAAALSYKVAGAYPDGAPWGAANPAAEQNCASCHFDAEPIADSEALVVSGLPGKVAPGTSHELEIALSDPDTVVAGFQLIAQAADEQAGTFMSSDSNVEFIGAAIRSTAPVGNGNPAKWIVEWRVPEALESDVVLYVAASAANDDGSPLGDTIHFRTYRIKAD